MNASTKGIENKIVSHSSFHDEEEPLAISKSQSSSPVALLSMTVASALARATFAPVSALDFSTFPTVLLLTTLFRLSLNVASTRNILLRGGSDGTSAAGQIIRSFGEFVVEGNYVVGIIVFIILAS